MSKTRTKKVFAIDGYEISATFAESRNPMALGQVKQILLSSFVDNATRRPGDILAISPKTRDNIDGGKHYAP